MKKFLVSIFVIAISISVLNGQPSARQVNKLIKSDNLKAVSELISGGLCINTTFKRHSTLLHMAARYSKFDIVKYLVDNGADLNIQDKDKYTPLLISTSNVFRNDSISEYLIDKGADLNIVGLHGSTALRETIGFGGYANNIYIFKLLIDKGADMNYNCNECCNRTVFLYCCGWGTTEMLQILLDNNVDINQADCNGLNGLMYAVRQGNIDNVKFLIKNEINLNHKDNKQKQAIDYTKNTDIIELLK